MDTGYVVHKTMNRSYRIYEERNRVSRIFDGETFFFDTLASAKQVFPDFVSGDCSVTDSTAAQPQERRSLRSIFNCTYPTVDIHPNTPGRCSACRFCQETRAK